MVEQSSPVSFCEWLTRRRKALDLTQDELSKRAGCSVSALRKIETGERRPSKQLAMLLAKALEIPDEDLQDFVRAARGEVNLGRLGRNTRRAYRPIPDVSILRQARQSTTNGIPSGLPAKQIPLPPTPLLGRETELAALARLFNAPQCRLLTLTGVGGIGKTRLAVEFVNRSPEIFPGGVFYFPVTAIESAEKIISAIAEVLDFGFSGPSDPKEQLFNFIFSTIQQQALFVFDNLEHLLRRDAKDDDEPDAAELVSEFLRRLPNVKILGTSRERLNIHGEWIYELHGLSVPPHNFAGPLEEYTSVTLFVNSAQRAKVDFQITPDEQAALIRICQLVDGVPLAIELAAAWVGVLSCQEIAREIETNMDFLSSSMRDMPERHRSLRATFDHSWNLLSDEERGILCQLSIFHGGFDRNAAYQIAGASLARMASLIDKSLVRRVEGGRYDLHEVIRQYAFSHLNENPCDDGIYERYCEYYLTFMHDREKYLKNASQQETIRQLTQEIENIGSAWSWAVHNKKFKHLRQAVRSYGWYFEIVGLHREGIEQLEILMQALNSEPDEDLRDWIMGATMVHQALLYFRAGEFDLARKYYEEGVVILRPSGDNALLADGLVFWGILLHLSGEYERARTVIEEGLACARASGDQLFEAYAIYNLGYIDSVMGSYQDGYEQMITGLRMWREVGDPHYIALGLNFLVPTLNKLGRYEEAKAYMRESISLCEQSKNRWGLGTAYRFMGLATLAEGQYGEAQILFRKSLDIYREYVVGYDIALTLTYLGEALLMSGDPCEARKDYQDGLRLAIEAKSIPIVMIGLSGLSKLQAQADRPQDALILTSYVINHPGSEEETKNQARQLSAALEKKLSPEQVKAARTKAEEYTLEVIVKEALEMV